VRDHVRGIRLVDRVRGLLESRCQIARLLRGALPHVAALEHCRSVACERLVDVRDVRQHLVLHLHEAGSVDRVFFGIGRNGRDLVALEHHDVSLRVRRFTPDECRFHTWRLLRGRQIHGDDACVRIRGADDAAVEHPRPVDVEGVLRAAGDLLGTVEALDRRAKHSLLRQPRIFRIRGWSLGRLSAATALGIEDVSHASPPSRSTPLRKSARRCRSGRCCHRVPCGSDRASGSGSSRAAPRWP